jgi:hypothetical protein
MDKILGDKFCCIYVSDATLSLSAILYFIIRVSHQWSITRVHPNCPVRNITGHKDALKVTSPLLMRLSRSNQGCLPVNNVTNLYISSWKLYSASIIRGTMCTKGCLLRNQTWKVLTIEQKCQTKIRLWTWPGLQFIGTNSNWQPCVTLANITYRQKNQSDNLRRLCTISIDHIWNVGPLKFN